ncbi:MAG TPA: M20/M25/M40 family metallo-hydrolase [Candidatus Lokiarchaeia archaeon]|nr:M20/M25/M40 family metallo-hydrolase [Candidatus Lokiarchaeia archaeon]
MNTTPDAVAPLIADTMEIIRRLSFPRLTGTPGEDQAAQEITRILEERYISFAEEEFTAGTFYMRVLNRLFFPIIGILMIAIFLFNIFGLPVVSVALSIFGILLSARIHLIIPWVLAKSVDLGKKLHSKNFVFSVGSSAAAVTSTKDAIILYFLAHWDSKTERNPVWYLFLVIIVGEILNLEFCLHFLIATAAAGFGFTTNPWVFVYGAVLGALTLPQLLNAMSNKSAGSLDNASGVAICIALAEHFLQRPPPANVALTFVLTGMEEFGDKGARKFLTGHRQEIDTARAHFIALDTIGDGNTIYINRHGLFPVKESDPALAAAIEQVKTANRGHFEHAVSQYLPPSPAITDAVPFEQAHFKTLVVASGTFKTHSFRDTIEAVDPARVSECINLLISTIEWLGNTDLK